MHIYTHTHTHKIREDKSKEVKSDVVRARSETSEDKAVAIVDVKQDAATFPSYSRVLL